MKIRVYAEMAAEVRKKLDRMAKKAAGYGVQFSYTESEEMPVVVRVLSADPVTRVQGEVSRHTVAGREFEIECDELIKANGWKVCAKIEHGERGNVVTGFAGYKVKPEWYTAEPHCDHCHVNRFRSVTYFVEHEDGTFRQVGSTCLKDYTGISPAAAAMWAEIRDLSDAGLDCSEDAWASRSMTQMFGVRDVLACACDTIRKFGYCKSCEPDSTKEKTLRLVESYDDPTEAGLREADAILTWVKGQTVDNAENDVVKNCIPIVLSGYVKPSHVGYLAYLPIAYKRACEREAWVNRCKDSEYVGTVGEHIEIRTETVCLLTSWENQWGLTHLYKMIDENGNVFIWYASKTIDAAGGEVIKATVKNHSERNGVKQTIVTRCYIAARD